MKVSFNVKALTQIILALSVIFSVLLTGIAPIGSGQAANPRVAYVYLSDTTARDLFNTMLTSKGITVDPYTVTEAATADFSPDQTIILSDDSGMTGGFPPDTVNNIQNSAKPVLGIGLEGWYFSDKPACLSTWVDRFRPAPMMCMRQISMPLSGRRRTRSPCSTR